MNAFILSTGRCGTTTFIRACQHIENYSAAHESRWHLLGDTRLAYPSDHIEADNRLSWLLGRLGLRYGDEAFYVHLTRDRDAVARSLDHRRDYCPSIIRAYRQDILGIMEPDHTICLDYCDTVNTNIQQFLVNKSHWMHFRLENAQEDFRVFWDWIGATGDLSSALAEWNKTYNQTTQGSLWRAAGHKTIRILRGLPRFMRQA